MKKVKKLLLTAVAALSLSACSFEDVKGYAVTAGEKIVEVWNNLLEKVGLKKKDEKKSDTPCEHKDENNDFKCDLCGVELAIKSVALDTKDAKLAYAVGDELDTSGVKVIATSEVGSKKELEFTTSTPDMSTTGSKKVTVSAKAGSETKTFEYSINVSYWSDEDIEVFEAASLTGYAPLPYLPSHNMRVEYEVDEEGYLESWKIVADNVTSDDYLEYYSRLMSWETVVEFSEDEVTTFELIETAVSGEGYDGLSEVSVYALIPHYYDADEEYELRSFTVDEYFVVGMNDENQLVVESVIVDACLDAFFFGTEFADGQYGYSGANTQLISYLPNPIAINYSFLSYLLFPLPDAETGTSAYFVPVNLKSVYPLSSFLADYDVAWEIYVGGQTQEVFDDYLAALVEAGFEKETVGEGDDAYDAYCYVSEYAGYMEFDPSFDSESGQITIDFFYVAPLQYTTHLTPIVAEVCELLGAGEDLEIIDDFYLDYGVNVAAFSAFEEGKDALGLAVDFGRTLVNSGFVLTEDIAYTEDATYGNNYSFTVANEEVEISIYVYEDLNESGKYDVEMLTYDASGAPAVDKAEAEAQQIYYNAYGSFGLRGFDYTVGEDEEGTYVTANAVISSSDATSLEEACELVALALPATYSLESSEAGEGDTFVQEYHDVERGFIVTLVSSEAEGGYSVSIKVQAHAFITPEVVMVEFLTSHNGAAPEAGVDYTADSESGACVANLTIEAVSASVEGLQAAAEALAAEFGEAFVISNSAADEDAWVVSLTNATSGIDAVVTLTVASETSYAAVVNTLFTPTPMTFAESALRTIMSMFGMTPELGSNYYQYDSYDYYYTTIVLSNTATGEEDLQQYCEYYATNAGGAVGLTVQASSEATTNSQYSVDSWTVTLLTSDNSAMAYFEVFVVGSYLVLCVDIQGF